MSSQAASSTEIRTVKRSRLGDEDDIPDATLRERRTNGTNRLQQRRNHELVQLTTANALTLRSAAAEQESNSDSSSDSSDAEKDEDEDEDKEKTGPGQLLQALTSKWKGHTEKMVVQLIKSGADIHERLTEPCDQSSTITKAAKRQSIGADALHFATRLGLFEACVALLEFNAEIDSQTDTGISALMVAVMFSNVQIVQLLIEAKASALLQQANGLTVTDMAILEGNSQIVEMLLEREKEEEENLEDEAIAAAVSAGADLALLPPREEDRAEVDIQEVLNQLVSPDSPHQKVTSMVSSVLDDNY